jgi:deoxynogalonate / 12-deoxyaklanonic acid monooxygenase
MPGNVDAVDSNADSVHRSIQPEHRGAPNMSNHTYDATGSGVITFVNTFTVHCPPEEFEKVFVEISEFMAAQPGFISYSLSRNVDEDKQDRYVNIALWTDVESWRNAVAHPGFQSHATEIRARSTNEGNLYAPRQAFSVK